MIKIAHFADIHIRNIERHEEYHKIFDKIYTKLNEIKPDRIVIVGDLFESFIEISNEAKIIAGDFLNKLSNISKVIITRGNHDIRKKNINRTDSIETIIKLINNPNIEYYNKTGLYKDQNITWVVYDHPDKASDPWLNQNKEKNQIYIGLFHDPIQDSRTDLGKVFTDFPEPILIAFSTLQRKKYNSLSDETSSRFKIFSEPSALKILEVSRNLNCGL